MRTLPYSMYLKSTIKKIKPNKAFFNKKVVKDFAAVVGTNLALNPIQLVKGFIVAKYLGPTDYGLLKSLELITMLNKYGNLGFNTAAAREVGNALGANDIEKANTVRNTAYTSEIILSLILFIIGTSSSIFFDSTTLSILIILASTSMLFSKLRGIISTEATIQKKFILISKITFLTTLISSLVIIATVPFFKIYAVMATNILAGVSAIFFFLKWLAFKYSFKINKKEFIRIFRISLPFAISTIAAGSFKYAERILILTYLGTESLGFFSIVAMIVVNVSILFKAPIRVRMQDIYESLGRKEYNRVHRMVVNETIITTLGSIVMVGILWVLADIIIPVFLSDWSVGISEAKLYFIILPFLINFLYPSIVLTSNLLNKQAIMPVLGYAFTGLLIVNTYFLSVFDILTLKSFIIINVFGKTLYGLIVIYLYKKYFYNTYIKRQIL